METLPVDIDTTYPDDGDASAAAHQQAHDLLHALNNDVANADDGTVFVKQGGELVPWPHVSADGTARGMDYTTLVAPDADATNGIVFVQPSPAAGDSGLENAWIVVDSGVGDAPGATLSRADWQGGIGCQSVHVSPKVGTTATQGVWIDPAADVIGQVIDGAAGGSADLAQYRLNDGTKLVTVEKDGAVKWWAGAVQVAAVESVAAPASLSRALIRSGSPGTIPVAVRGETAQTQDLQWWGVQGNPQISKVDAGGRYPPTAATAPADADIDPGEMFLWFDPTNGAPRLMVKAKQANGTVVTGQLALA